MTQRDPNGLDPHEPGAKLDLGKPEIFRGLIAQFPNALTQVADISAYGARKYTWGGWRHVPDAEWRYLNALMRHLVAFASGEHVDRESMQAHLAHAAWNILAVLELDSTTVDLPQWEKAFFASPDGLDISS